MSNRPITFSKMGTLGEWVNHETGVVIQKQTDGSYRPFRPADTSTGYIGISRAKRTLAEARAAAVSYIDGSIRHQMGVAYAEAVAEHAARAADAAEAAGAPTWRAAAARRMIGYAIEGRTGWLASAINEVRRLEEWTAEYARMAHEQIDEAHAEALAEDAERQVEQWKERHGGASLRRAFLADHVEALEDDAAYQQNAEYRHSMQWQRTVDEDHAEASREGGAPVTLMTKVAKVTTPSAPDDIEDDEAWAEYLAATTSAPTDAELVAVLAEHNNPYAEEIASCEEGFRAAARMIWQNRREGGTTPLSYSYLRNSMRTHIACKRTYQQLNEAAAYMMLSRMHIAASFEGDDAATETFDGPVA